MSHSLDKRSVAEYVESKEIFDALKEIGIDYGQGYYISRPLPVEQLTAVLQTILSEKTAC
ncbi:EAL domain-containing protein [Pseudoalteromonas sp. R96]|nr:EAL domain-containing protein [Pseudoalteromonas sp. R96]MDK1311964.1 EAL domain-containing protein [Pseudoalteromonas sp. R96]